MEYGTQATVSIKLERRQECALIKNVGHNVILPLKSRNKGHKAYLQAKKLDGCIILL